MYLKPNVAFEPLYCNWYAWVHMVPPATAALNLAHRYVNIMRSYVASPMLHMAALADPAMKGGPFIDLAGKRVSEVKQLLAQVMENNEPSLRLAQALGDLDGLLQQKARGLALEGLYAEVPEILKGLVELCYDRENQPSFRVMEPLMYRSAFYAEHNQSIALRLVEGEDQRPFIMSTPRLDEPEILKLPLTFNSPALDALFMARRMPQEPTALAEQLGVTPEQLPLFLSFFGPEAPKAGSRYEGEGMRVRYYGHATLLLESRETAILIDPVVGYGGLSGETPRFSLDDLPDFIDYVLITHAHHDHILPETLLQIRHKVGTVVVGRNLDGLVQDPSLQLALRAMGFANVVEMRDLDEISLPGGSIMAVPFIGEHHDLLVQSKTGYLVRLEGRSVLAMVDSCNMQAELYQRVHAITGDVDALFVAMECEGAPISWIYGPLYRKMPERTIDRSRMARGCNFQEALSLAEIFGVGQCYIYAMGQEPWLQHILDNTLDENREPILESRRLIEACRARGLTAAFLFGRADITIGPTVFA